MYGDSKATRNRWIVRLLIYNEGGSQYFTPNGSILEPRWTEVKSDAARFQTKRAAEIYAKPLAHSMREVGLVSSMRYEHA